MRKSFQGKTQIPSDFPNNPPKMNFATEIFHPNVYENGDVCIHLHSPVKILTTTRGCQERRPIRVEAVIVSVISMLGPKDESPANSTLP